MLNIYDIFFRFEIMILKFIWKNKYVRIFKEILEKKKSEGKDFLLDMKLVINKLV